MAGFVGGAGASGGGRESDWCEGGHANLFEAEGGVFGEGVVGEVHDGFDGMLLDFVGFGGGVHSCGMYESLEKALRLYRGIPAEGGSLALAMRSLVLVKLLKAFSQEASFPPSGPMMNPRYSAAAQMLKEAHLGQCLVRKSRVSWMRLGVSGLPRGINTHLLALSPRPEMRSKTLKAR